LHVNFYKTLNPGGDFVDKLNIQNVPEPFRQFLGLNQKGSESKFSEDLLFLAAILMLCD